MNYLAVMISPYRSLQCGAIVRSTHWIKRQI